MLLFIKAIVGAKDQIFKFNKFHYQVFVALAAQNFIFFHSISLVKFQLMPRLGKPGVSFSLYAVGMTVMKRNAADGA